MPFRKLRLRRQVRRCKRRIEMFEQRRARSQAALIEALLANTHPDDKDVDFFNQFSQLIDHERDKMHAYMDQLEQLKKKQ